MNKSNKTYKPSKPNKILKGIFAFIAAATLTLGAAACTPTQPNTPVEPKPPITDIDPSDPDKPTDPTQKDPNEKDPNEKDPTKPSESEQEEKEKLALENAKTEYNTFVNKLFDVKNFTYQEGDDKTELANDKAKVTVDGEETYFAKEDNILYNFTKDDKGEWKKEEEKEITLEKIENDIKDKLTIESDNWTKLDNGTLIGKLADEKISAEIDKNTDDKTLTLKIGDSTITISHAGNTAVIIPEIKEVFDVNEHIDELEKGLETYLSSYLGQGNKINNIFNVYLRKSDENNFVDTVGLVYEFTPLYGGGRSLSYTEIKNPEAKEDLTYEQICNGELKYKGYHVSYSKFNANISPSNQTKYKEGIDILLNGLFEKDVRDNAAWYGWRYDSSPAEISNQIYLLENNKIYIKKIAVSSKGSSLDVVEAIKQNFKDKLEGDSKTTWKTEEDRIIEIPSDSINIWAYHQNNIEQDM